MDKKIVFKYNAIYPYYYILRFKIPLKIPTREIKYFYLIGRSFSRQHICCNKIYTTLSHRQTWSSLQKKGCFLALQNTLHKGASTEWHRNGGRLCPSLQNFWHHSKYAGKRAKSLNAMLRKDSNTCRPSPSSLQHKRATLYRV